MTILIPSQILSILFISTCFVSLEAIQRQRSPLSLRNDSVTIQLASIDYGNLMHEIPSSVLFPISINDIVQLIKFGGASTVATRGHAHSVRGQAMARGGVVVHMTSLSGKSNGLGIKISGDSFRGFYVDIGGEQLWIDVLRFTLDRGLSPVSWTDYLYLTVGGTLSNAGISGQTFAKGPEISNVLELDVITGKGEFISCSRNKNPNLFMGVLGGLGQFGIITRARIVLANAPTRVKWAKLLYSNFSAFTEDQERLISVGKGNGAPDYVEGILLTNSDEINQWRSNGFSSSSNQSDIVALLKEQRILYAIELVNYYDNQTMSIVEQEFETILKGLNYIPSFIFRTDATYFDFLARVPNLDDQTGPALSHPWLNLFIPKSGVSKLNEEFLATMLPNLNESSGIFIFYPLNSNKWDTRMSAVIPNGDIFYALGLLHTSAPNDARIYDDFNKQLLSFCKMNGIAVKQYLPHYESQQEWIEHFGPKWEIFKQRKEMFDPKFILSPGQRIFN